MVALADIFAAATEAIAPEPSVVDRWLPYILGAGGAGFLATLVKFVLALRDSAETREAKAISNLERWRDDSDERANSCLKRLDRQILLTSYWQVRAGVLEHALSTAGCAIPPPEPPPAPLDPVV